MVDLLENEQEFLLAIALNGLAPLASERTPQALYYILRGRKANQTIQDVHIYRLYPYYRLFPVLSKEQWEEIIQTLLCKQLIRLRETSGTGTKLSFLLTNAGEEARREGHGRFLLDRWFAPLQQMHYVERLQSLWQRLHLMLQTISQLLHKELSFYPVVRQKQIQRWVKETLSQPESRVEWLDGLYDELYLLVNELPTEQQRLIIFQLSGAAQAGKTVQQIARQKGEATSYIHLQMMCSLAQLHQRLESSGQSTFPLLHRMIAEGRGEKNPLLSESAHETYHLLQRRLTVTEIANRRNIKVSTVEDHLIEIALHCPEWNSSAYLTVDQRQKITAASVELGTNRLRLLKDHLGAEFTYLQIRLALAFRREAIHES